MSIYLEISFLSQMIRQNMILDDTVFVRTEVALSAVVAVVLSVVLYIQVNLSIARIQSNLQLIFKTRQTLLRMTLLPLRTGSELLWLWVGRGTAHRVMWWGWRVETVFWSSFTVHRLPTLLLIIVWLLHQTFRLPLLIQLTGLNMTLSPLVLPVTQWIMNISTNQR